MERWFCSNNPEKSLIRALRKVKSSKYLLLLLFSVKTRKEKDDQFDLNQKFEKKLFQSDSTQ